MQAAGCEMADLLLFPILSSFPLYLCSDDTDDLRITHCEEIHGFCGKMNPQKLENKKQCGDFFQKSSESFHCSTYFGKQLDLGWLGVTDYSADDIRTKNVMRKLKVLSFSSGDGNPLVKKNEE